MATNIDDILAQVQKLLNVEGRTPAEAAAYVEKAHAILAKHDLSIESVASLKADPRTSVRKSDAAVSTTAGKPDGWKSDVLEAVAATFECKVMYTSVWEETKSGGRSRRDGYLVGFGHDVEAAGYALSFVINEITRLAKEYSRVGWGAIRNIAQAEGITNHQAESRYVWMGNSHPLKAELYFIKGAAQTISESLAAEARKRRTEAVEVNPFGLVVQKSDAIRDFEYMERYGKTYEEVKRERDAQMAAWKASEASRAKEKPPVKPETDAQRRRREEREARANERYSRAYWNRVNREAAKTDHTALQAGQEAGRTISIRRGVRPGTNPKEGIGG